MLDKIEQQWLMSFLCVYENRSFKRAADFLHLPTSNVSRHIAQLEDSLDTRLFNRTTRRVTATEAGEHLYQRTQPLMEKLGDALEEVTSQSQEVSGQLKVLMPDSPIFGQALISFCSQNPAISICCDTSANPTDDMQDGFDVVLSFHRGKLVDNSWVAKEILRWQSVVVASPKLLKQQRKPQKITDLKYLPCINSFTAINGMPWVFKNSLGGFVTQRVRSAFKVNSGQIAKQATLQGLGLAILPLEFCQAEIESGELEKVILEHEPEDLVLYVFYPSRKHLAKKIPSFIQHLQRFAIHEMNNPEHSQGDESSK
ncbi:LysR family transcriptional regulator [Vibrio sonorensis]|uniref:LysR family transcriptional regulator n=1 Tax=Vibrio sonorensis TaxID=1004316 RepID=UPI0008D9AB12|nr:LysR family transcriptional regulator [Vibrio sonorensis]